VTIEALAKLRRILEANKDIDWRGFPFEDQSLLRAVRWQEHQGEQERLIPLLKAYQRLLRILPAREDHRALPLLRMGFLSAVQIAGMPKSEFARQWEALFPGEAGLGAIVYQNALERRSYVLLQHVNSVQCSEPHYRAARFR
jgi:hypothetical protein